MKTLRLFIISLLFVGCTQAEMPAKPKVSDSVELTRLTQEYVNLAAGRNVYFTNNPFSIGFKTIDERNVIGVCTWRAFSRNVLIDPSFWADATETTRKILVFHELTHCLCNREHDYGDSIPYLDPQIEKIVKNSRLDLSSVRSGYFNDGCPVSIMHPVMIHDGCTELHEEEYLKEMFNHCNPW